MIERIKQQGEVVGIVNSFVDPERRLAGLSAAAIADWKTRNSQLYDVERVQGCLLEIGKQIGCLHDRSNPPRALGVGSSVGEHVEVLIALFSGDGE